MMQGERSATALRTELAPMSLTPCTLHNLAPSNLQDHQNISDESSSERSLHPIRILSVEILTAVGKYIQRIGQAQDDRQRELCSRVEDRGD